VIEDGRAIGRIYEDLHALPELRWFWSIIVFVGYRPGVMTDGRTIVASEWTVSGQRQRAEDGPRSSLGAMRAADVL
jgi:hypothetical protein